MTWQQNWDKLKVNFHKMNKISQIDWSLARKQVKKCTIVSENVTFLVSNMKENVDREKLKSS